MSLVNNVTRLLDAHKIRYVALVLPAAKLGALETAQLLNASPEQVFKTIVVKQERLRRPLLVLVPATSTVDLKKVASAVGEKKVQLPSEREAEALTGLRAGGISPLALMNKGFSVLIDSSAHAHAEIHVSGGQRGLNIKLAVGDLAMLTRARFADLSRPTPDLQDAPDFIP